MIRFNQNLTYSLLSTLGLICLLCSLPLVNTIAAENEWGKANRVELEHLFDLATRSLPDKMFLEAKIDIQEPPMSEEDLQLEIDQDLKNAIERHQRIKDATGQPRPQQELDSLKVGIRNYLTDRFSGKRKLSRKEWFSRSGRLLRIDKLDNATLIADSVLQSKITSGEVDSSSSEITISDPDFLRHENYPKAKGIAIIHGISSASVFVESSFQFDPPELWQAYSIEPELAFPITSLLMVPDSLPESSPIKDSMAGIKRNDQNVRKAADDGIAGWHFQARDEMLNGIPTRRIRISGSPSSIFSTILIKIAERNTPKNVKRQIHDASSAIYSYWIEKHSDPPRLLRAEKAIRGGNRNVSIRKSFNDHEFPTRWISEIYDSQNQLQRSKQVVFTTANLEPEFKEQEVFGTQLLEKLDIVDRDGVRVQSKYEATRIDLNEPNPEDHYSQWTIRIIFFLFLLFPIYYLRRKFNIEKHS